MATLTKNLSKWLLISGGALIMAGLIIALAVGTSSPSGVSSAGNTGPYGFPGSGRRSRNSGPHGDARGSGPGPHGNASGPGPHGNARRSWCATGQR